mmetsp:Transcript_4279/g.11680  ORF Transcript_4279/g.11680 Transcript_4279/m.11680 type:complete len:103 (+) Transcript_4279:1564-1872(+)
MSTMQTATTKTSQAQKAPTNSIAASNFRLFGVFNGTIQATRHSAARIAGPTTTNNPKVPISKKSHPPAYPVVWTNVNKEYGFVQTKPRTSLIRAGIAPSTVR